MKVSGKNILYGVILFVLGTGFLDNNGDIPYHCIHVYVTQPDVPLYFKEAFDLSEKFLRNEMGLNIIFMHVKKTEIPPLDYLNSLAITEIDPESMARIEYEKRKAGNHFRQLGDFDRWLDNTRAENRIPYEGTCPDFLLRKRYKGLSAKAAADKFNFELMDSLKRFFRKANGIAYIDERIAYILPNALLEYKGVKNDACDSCKKTYGYQAVKTSREDKIKLQAKNIIHEFSHLTGLWHPDIFKNDTVDAYAGDQPNALAKGLFHLGYGTYGFAFNQFQEDWIKGFFSKGKPYRLFRKAIDQKGHWDNSIFKRILKEEFNFS